MQSPGPAHAIFVEDPVSEEEIRGRRNKIFDAACILLQRHGYSGLSIEKLARKACMSKKTIYQIFENKERLLSELLQERLFRPMTFHKISEGASLAEQLTNFMRQLYEHCVHPDNLALLRLLIGESERSVTVEQTLSQMIHLSDKESPIHLWLLEKKQEGLLEFKNLEETSARLFGLVLGAPFISHLLKCLHKEQNSAWMDDFIQEGVRVFLAGYATQTAGKI